VTTSPRRPLCFATRALSALALVVLTAGCIPNPEPITAGPIPPPPPRPQGPNPLAGTRLYVDPGSAARGLAESWRASRSADAAALDRIAGQPHADWFGDWNRNVAEDVDTRVSRADDAGAVPVMVVYNIPFRDCGQYSAGGARDASGYRVWIREVARGIKNRKVVVILEPDALALIDKCLSSADQQGRFALISDAVRVLAANPGTKIYIDAGHANWVSAEQMAPRLKAAGVDGADGFAINVSNYVGTPESIAYGKGLSARLGGKHFVVDTSRNGNGAALGGEWCNPPGRALGHPPTVSTGEPLADAFLWIKPPGESDGTCNGGPRAGEWWPEYALGLAKRASW
jgi:endoglucanase